MLDQVTGDETLLKGRVVVSWDEDLVGNRQGGEPVDERSKLGLVAVRVPPVGGITTVNHHVDTVGNDELAVL